MWACWYWNAELKLLQILRVFKACKRNDRKLGFAKKANTETLSFRNCKSMEGSWDHISWPLVRNSHLPCWHFWVRSSWSFLQSYWPGSFSVPINSSILPPLNLSLQTISPVIPSRFKPSAPKAKHTDFCWCCLSVPRCWVWKCPHLLGILL